LPGGFRSAGQFPASRVENANVNVWQRDSRSGGAKNHVGRAPVISFNNQINKASQKNVARSSGPVLEMFGFEVQTGIAPAQVWEP
jgi:hypothetical protein